MRPREGLVKETTKLLMLRKIWEIVNKQVVPAATAAESYLRLFSPSLYMYLMEGL
jgi:hypothetical protein